MWWFIKKYFYFRNEDKECDHDTLFNKGYYNCNIVGTLNIDKKRTVNLPDGKTICFSYVEFLIAEYHKKHNLRHFTDDAFVFILYRIIQELDKRIKELESKESDKIQDSEIQKPTLDG